MKEAFDATQDLHRDEQQAKEQLNKVEAEISLMESALGDQTQEVKVMEEFVAAEGGVFVSVDNIPRNIVPPVVTPPVMENPIDRGVIDAVKKAAGATDEALGGGKMEGVEFETRKEIMEKAHADAQKAIEQAEKDLTEQFTQKSAEKDTDMEKLRSEMETKTQAVLFLQTEVKTMKETALAYEESKGKQTKMMKSLTSKLTASEKKIGHMVQRPPPVATDSMGIHKAMKMFGDGAHKVSQGDYTSSESTAAILALVFLFGVAMIGMNYAKGGLA